MSSAACVKRACTFPSYTFIASIPMALLNTGTVRNVVCQYINIYIIIYVCVYTDIPLKESTIYFYIAKQNHVSEPTSLHTDKNLAGFSTSWRAASTHKECEKNMQRAPVRRTTSHDKLRTSEVPLYPGSQPARAQPLPCRAHS